MSVLSLPVAPENANNGDMYYNTVEQEYYNFVDGEWVKQVTEDNATVIVQEVVVDEGYIKNTATGSNSLTILGVSAQNSSTINIGVGSEAKDWGNIAIGKNTYISSSAGGIGIGYGARVHGAKAGISIGWGADSEAQNAIVLGNHAINTEANTLKVSFNTTDTQSSSESDGVYKLLNSDGTIPKERLSNLILDDKAVAGTGIHFEQTIKTQNFTIVGNPSINSSSYVISGFSDDNYIVMNKEFPSSGLYKIIFRVSYYSRSHDQMIMAVESDDTNLNEVIFMGSTSGTKSSKLTYYDYHNDYVSTSSINQTGFWIGMLFDSSTKNLKFYWLSDMSGDVRYTKDTLPDFSDSSWHNTLDTTVGYDIFSGNKFRIGRSLRYTGCYWEGSIDLKNTFIQVNGEDYWTPYTFTNEKEKIVSDCLMNASTAESSLSISNWGTGYSTSVNIGPGSGASSASSTTLGYCARAESGSTNSVALGYCATTKAQGAIAIGGSSNYSTYTTASGLNSIAIGNQSQAKSNYSIQLGRGVNEESNTLKIGLDDVNNYTLLDSDGCVPKERLNKINIEDIAEAGDGINFENKYVENTKYSIVGSDVSVSDSKVASGFSSSSYITANVWNKVAGKTSFEYHTKFNITEGGNSMIATQQVNTSSGNVAFRIYAYNTTIYAQFTVKNQYNNTSSIGLNSSYNAFSYNTDYYLKFVFTGGTGIKLYLSTDDTTWTEIASTTTTYQYVYDASDVFVIGNQRYYSSYYMRGSIDLSKTYIKVGENIVWQPYMIELDTQIINAEKQKVDLTDIATAGTGIAFTTPVNYTEVGTGLTITDGVVSGFTTSDYLKANDSPFYNKTVNSFEIVSKFSYDNTASGARPLFKQLYTNDSSYNIQLYIIGGKNVELDIFGTSAASYITTPANTLSTTDPNWIKVSWNANEKVKILYSSNGTDYTQVAESDSTISAIRNSGNIFTIGYMNGTTPYALTDGSIDLNEFSVKVNGVVWTPISDKKQINTAAIQGSTAPTSSTVGSLGQFYVDTTNQNGYMCVVSNGPVKAFTTIGSPTLTDGVLSNISASNYITADTIFNPGNSNWEFNIKFTTASTLNNTRLTGSPLSGSTGFVLAIGTSNMVLYMKTEGGSGWDIVNGVAGSCSISTNTTYWYRLQYVNGVYTSFVSIDGTNYAQDWTLTSSSKIGSITNPISYCIDGSRSFTGSVDLNETNIYVDGSLLWKPITSNGYGWKKITI